MTTRESAPRISIVVATYNRSALLVRCLESLAGMTLDRGLWEAVIVNNNSTDDTVQVFERCVKERQTSNIRMVSEPLQGLSHARNRGISESRGEIIAIIDDDELVNPGFAGGYLGFFDSHPGAAAAGGKITPLYEGERPRWISKYTEVPIAGTLDLGAEVKEFPGGRNPFGGNMAFRREILEKAGVFDPAYGRSGGALLAGEEKELFERIRREVGRIYWVPGPEIFHIIDSDRLTPDYFRRLNYMGGVSERRRTLARSKAVYAGRLLSEAIKWLASLVLAMGHCLRGEPSKGRYLLVMRAAITRGLLNRDGE